MTNLQIFFDIALPCIATAVSAMIGAAHLSAMRRDIREIRNHLKYQTRMVKEHRL